MNELLNLPADLPIPRDDGACAHLPGMALPPVGLLATDGSTVRLDDPAAPRYVLTVRGIGYRMGPG